MYTVHIDPDAFTEWERTKLVRSLMNSGYSPVILSGPPNIGDIVFECNRWLDGARHLRAYEKVPQGKRIVYQERLEIQCCIICEQIPKFPERIELPPPIVMGEIMSKD